MKKHIVNLLCLIATAFIGCTPAHAQEGELLYNGIQLPAEWPPVIRHLGVDPMDVPYLKAPPEVIPIDVGRQLFVDDFLIEETTLARTFHKAVMHRANPLLKPDKKWEFEQKEPKDPPQAMPFSDGVWFDPADQTFKMWYVAGWHMATCYATSKDGVHWQKPSLDIVPGTNIVQDGSRDSATVWLDQFETDPKKRFKMMRRDNESRLHEIHFSPDGLHWSEGLAAGNAFDRSTFFYNPFRKVWGLSIRGDSIWNGTETADASIVPRFTNGNWIGVQRFRRYVEGPDLLSLARSWPTHPVNDADSETFKDWHQPPMWVWADHLDTPREDIGTQPEIYNVDAVAYESVMLGLFSIWEGEPPGYPKRDKINEVELAYSRDGFHWDRPSRESIIGVSENPAAWNHSNVQSAGGGCLIVGDKLYFYVSGRMVRDVRERKGYSSTGLAVMRRDGFASMDAGSDTGTLLTRPIRFSGKHLFVNVNNPEGELRAEILDEEGNVIAPFSVDNSQPVQVDSTIQQMTWTDGADLSSLSGKNVRIRFTLENGELYSFWVSPDENGASHGYVAAGGPGFTSSVDTVGIDGYKNQTAK